MNIQTHDPHYCENLSKLERTVRAGIVFSLLIYTLTTPVASLGWLAVLPLLAIYPMYTAIVGWDPLRFAISLLDLHTEQCKMWSRIANLAVGASFIAITLFSQIYPLNALALMALLGCIPVFLAIWGENPIRTLIAVDKTPVVVETVSDTLRPVPIQWRYSAKNDEPESASNAHNHEPAA